ncbi:MAG TPA: alpha/beta hydrolase, partial [Phycisphaerae bacterium]|nr:alpha/beta hydrolase [Phycisphaerae bacterium]
AGTLQPPVRLLLAGRDRIIRNEPTVAWLRRIAAQPPEIHIDSDAAHTLEFEVERTTLEEQLTHWLAM